MRRFHYDDNDDFQDDVDGFFAEEIDFDENDYIGDELMEAASINFVSYDLNQRLLRAAIQVCEKSVFWRFKSVDSKLRKITKMYLTMKTLVED